MRFKLVSIILFIFLAAALLSSCGTGVEDGQTPTPTNGEAIATDGLPEVDPATPSGKIRLKVMIAGSLMVPFGELEQAYEAAHPEIDVEVEAHGSIQVIRHVTEIGDLVDVVVPADYNLIPMLMYTTEVPESGEKFTNWYLEFASNRLALAYTDQSALADTLTAENWYEVLADPEVRLGLSDPRFDASGYRTLMIMQLAEEAYNNPTIFERTFLGRFTNNIRVQKSGGQAVIHVPEVLEPTETSNIVMRGSSIALIALLESGEIDYAFEYESVIKQQGLNYLPLPEALNMGSPEMSAAYAGVQVQLDFRRFTSVSPIFDGALIGYGITIPANAPHPQEALDFVAFVVGPEGQAIMAANQHPPLETPTSPDCAAAPKALQAFCAEN